MIWRRLLHDAFKLAAAGLGLLMRSALVKETQSRKDIAPTRATCRNFFNLHQRWQFAVLRLVDTA